MGPGFFLLLFIVSLLRDRRMKKSFAMSVTTTLTITGMHPASLRTELRRDSMFVVSSSSA
jgi:hypothetical protein